MFDRLSVLLRQLFCLILFFPLILFAIPPPIPSAGVIEREIEQEYESKPLEMEKEIPSVEVEIPEEKLTFPAGKTVLIRQIEIEGNDVISTREIQGWVKGFLNRDLSISDIYQICPLPPHR